MAMSITASIAGRKSATPATFDRPSLWTGDGTALVTGDGRSITYHEVHDAVDALAERLTAHGFAPGMCAAVVSTRTPHAIAAMLAIWAAGGTVVPVDAGWPPARVRAALDGAQVACAFLDDAHDRPDSHPAGTAIWRSSGVGWHSPDQPISGPAQPSRPAYVMFTSGSSGTPKGVVVSRPALGNYLAWRTSAVDWPDGFRVLAMASLGFDVMLRELIWPLTVGGTVVLLDDDQRLDSSQIVSALREHDIDLVHILPSLLALVVAEPGFADLPRLRLVHSGAEPLPWALVREFRARSSAALHHSYGPTEATVSVTFLDVTGMQPRDGGAVPLGHPLDNVEIHLRDAELSPVGPGEVGEICIAGTCLADGYLNLPAETSAAFTTDPADPTRRLYRTGDLAVLGESGDLMFQGRRDEQVKVRGHRIEPAEVEIALRGLGARAAVVTASASHEQLLAAVTVEPGVEPAAIRAALRDILPGYLIPDHIEPVAQMPRLPNGKVDRRAEADRLRAARGTAEVGAAEHERDTVQAVVSSVWSAVLGLSAVGPADNFFDLGGNSMNAMRISSRLSRQLGHRIQVRLLFDFPVLGELSDAIQGQLRGASAVAR